MSTPTLATPSSPTRPNAAPLSLVTRRGLRRSAPGTGGATPYLFLSPYLALTAVFFVAPLIYATRLAFHQTSGQHSQIFVGWENFRFVLGDPDFRKAVWNTCVFALCSVCIQLPMSLGLAILLDKKAGWSKGLFRLAIFSPNLVGQVFVGIMFQMLFTPRYGLFNVGLQKLVGWGIDQQWLSDPSLVMPAIVIASLWLYVGFNMIYFLAALQNVDKSLVEAATIDGASAWGIFWNVTRPAIMPVTTFVVVTSTIGSFQLFELPYVLLQGNGGGFGPKGSGLTIVGYLYQYAFDANDLGTGAAVGWLLTLMVLAISLVQVWVGSRSGRST